MFVNGIKITGEQMNAEGGSVIIIEKFIEIVKSTEEEEADIAVVETEPANPPTTVAATTTAVETTTSQSETTTRRRSIFRRPRSTTTVAAVTTEETTSAPSIASTTSPVPNTSTTTASSTTTEKLVLQSKKTSGDKRKARPSPLFKSFRNKNDKPKLSFHQRPSPVVIEKANVEEEKPISTTSKPKRKNDEKEETKSKPKQKQSLQQRTKLTLRQRTKQRLLQRAKQNQKQQNKAADEPARKPALQQRKVASTTKEVNKSENKVAKPSPPVVATRFEKFKNRVKLSKERKAKQKSISSIAPLENFSITSTPKLSTTTTAPEATTEIDRTTETATETTEVAEEVTEMGIIAPVIESKTETEVEETTEDVAIQTTAATVSEETPKDAMADIFASFAASLTTESTVTTTEESAADDKKEAGILAAFNQFVQSTQSKETTASKMFTETTSPTPEVDMEFPLSEFISGDEPQADAEMSQDMKLSEIVGDGPEVHSLTNSFENANAGFLGWLKNEVRERKQLGGKEFLNHLIESGVAKQLLAGKL